MSEGKPLTATIAKLFSPTEDSFILIFIELHIFFWPQSRGSRWSWVQNGRMILG